MRREDLLDILKKYEQELKALEGVISVNIGNKYEKGHPTGDLAICVFVVPGSAVELSQRIRAVIKDNEIPIDVTEGNRDPQNREREKYRNPLVGGIAVWNTLCTKFGTLGAIVYDAKTLAPMALSNHHIFNGKEGLIGGDIAQGDINDNTANGIIGTVVVDKVDVDLDCALCILNDARGREPRIEGYPIEPGSPNGPKRVRRPSKDMRVIKSGVATGITRGIVDKVWSKEFRVKPDPDYPSHDGEISTGGDSGSVWLEVESFDAVGLHYDGEKDRDPRAEMALAKRMDKIVDKLDIKFSV